MWIILSFAILGLLTGAWRDTFGLNGGEKLCGFSDYVSFPIVPSLKTDEFAAAIKMTEERGSETRTTFFE